MLRFVFLLLLPLPLLAQQPQLAKPATVAPAPELSLQQAVAAGLEYNYGILLSRKDQQVAENNVTRGNAGQLPVVNGNFTRTFNINNVRQESSARPEASIANGARSNLFNTNIAATWTIFDGLGMFIAYDRLKTLRTQQQVITKATVEETVEQITNAYYAVVREGGKIRSLEEALKIGQARIDLTQARVDVGLAAKVEVLTARVDYNADRSLLLQQQQALVSAKTALNNLIGRAPRTDFQPSDSLVVTRGLNADSLRAAMLARNPRLAQARLGVDVATYDRRLVRASRFPQVGLSTGYGFNRNINGAAFFGNQLVTNTGQTYGLNYGVVASVPIFDGFNRRRLEQNARIVEEQSKLALGQTTLQLDTDAAEAYAQYQNYLQLLDLEEDNIKLADQNVAIALERYRLGLLTPLDLRTAQRVQLDAAVRLLDIRYFTKQAETLLRRLSGDLVQGGD
jgi:outer membrane protein